MSRHTILSLRLPHGRALLGAMAVVLVNVALPLAPAADPASGETAPAQAHESEDLLSATLLLARSPQPADQQALLHQLTDSNFLERLDSMSDYIQQAAGSLRLSRVMAALATNTAAPAHQTLVSLTESVPFTCLEPRQELLVRALASVRPAPPEAVRFWDAQSQPDSINLHSTIAALCDNGSEPAIALLELKFADPNQEVSYKRAWLHDDVLRHRNDLILLRACNRMLRRGLPGELRPVLVESLCDYQADWYFSEPPPQPPPRDAATPDARAVLRRICDYALHDVTLTASQKAAVKRTLKELGDAPK
jgi:hypothetical protein